MGIITLKDGVIDFTNQIAEDILMDLDLFGSEIRGFDKVKEVYINKKMFKIHKFNESKQLRHRSIFMD